MSTTHNTPTRSGDSSAMEVDANVETSVTDNMSENSGYTQLQTETVVAWSQTGESSLVIGWQLGPKFGNVTFWQSISGLLI